VFLLPSLVLGLLVALLAGGKPSRLVGVRFRAPLLVPLALGIQAVLFSRLSERLDADAAAGVHLASYALLIAFGALNVRVRGLALLLLGLLLNAVAIALNGGTMPVSPSAARALGLDPGANVSVRESVLTLIGDTFALPSAIPLANVFSIGDVLIGLGAAAFVVVNSLPPRAEPVSRLARATSPLRLPPFRRLFAGRLVSLVGDWLTIAALVSWSYGSSESVVGVAILLLLRIGPPILGGTVASVLVDRLPPRRLAVSVELLRAAAVVGALAGVAAGSHAAVYVAVGLSGCCAALSEAFVGAVVPRLLPPDSLEAGNAALGLAQNIAMAVGALGGGIAVATLGPEGALLVDVGSFLLAAVILAGLPALAPAAAEKEDEGFAPLRALRCFRGKPRLIVLVAAFAAATFATGLANVSLPGLLETDLGLGVGGYGVGFAALATGLALGRGAVGFMRVDEIGLRWVGVALLAMATCFVGLGLVEHAPTAILLLALIGAADGTTDVVFDTVVQQEAEPSSLGAVFGLSSALYTSTMVAAVSLGPLLHEVLEPGAVIVTASVFLVAAGAIALLGTLRKRASAAPSLPTGARLAQLRRRGDDLSVITWGELVDDAEAAANALAAEVSVEIVSVPPDGPWNRTAVLRSVEKTSRAIVLHLDGPDERFAAEVAAVIAEQGFEHLDAPVRRVSVAHDDVVASLRELARY
jgi:hypothetical protein